MEKTGVWQDCPHCKGTGHEHQALMGTNSVFPKCTVCNGQKIISQITGSPPSEPSEEKPTEGDVTKAYKEIELGEIFTVEGKHYMFRAPQLATEKANTDHGHILNDLYQL